MVKNAVLPQEASQREIYERFTHDDHSSDGDEAMEHWEEGQDEDSPSDKMTQRTNYERFVHHDYLSNEHMEEDHVNVPPIKQFQDGRNKTRHDKLR